METKGFGIQTAVSNSRKLLCVAQSSWLRLADVSPPRLLSSQWVMHRLHGGAGERSLENTFHIQTPVKTHGNGPGILGGLFDHTLNKTAVLMHFHYMCPTVTVLKMTKGPPTMWLLLLKEQ